MTTIVTRAGKGSALTHNEVDANFTNLNNAKYESGNNATLGTIQGSTITATTNFSGNLTGNVTGDVSGNAGTVTNGVYTTGNQTIGGTKTFSSTILGNLTGDTSGAHNGTVGATTPAAGAFTTLSATGVTTVQAGSASAPAITTSGDTNTGIFFPAADAIAFTEGGVEAMRINSAGNVGIGTSSPGVKLDVAGQIASQDAYLITANSSGTPSAGAFIFRPASNTIALGTASTERMRITDAGNVGIGTSSPGARLHLTTSVGINAASDMLRLSSVDGDPSVYVGLQAQRDNASGQGLNIQVTNVFGTIFEAARITPAGNVGIGTSSPGTDTRLNVSGRGLFTSGSYDSFDGTASGVSISYDTSNNVGIVGAIQTGVAEREMRLRGSTLTFYANGATERMRINSAGNVGIGTSSPGYRLDVASTSSNQVALQYSGVGRYLLGCDSGFNLIFSKEGTGERMRIDSSGNLLVGQTATSSGADGRLSVTTTGGSPAATFKNDAGASQSTGIFYNSATTGNNSFVLFGTEGSFTARGGITYNRGAGLVAYNTTSDQRLKENIVDASSALSKIDSVKIRSFDWKESGNHVDFGVIAQELIAVAPECVTEGDNDDEIKATWQVDTSALVPALVKAIQELNAKVTALEAQLNKE